MNREEQLAIGEWVRGKTRNGELIHGFVENIDSAEGTVHVYVVNCDNDATMGKVVATLASRLEVMPESGMDYEEQVYALIDLALSTKDREWFAELVAISWTLKKGLPSAAQGGKRSRCVHHRNRLGTSAIWE